MNLEPIGAVRVAGMVLRRKTFILLAWCLLFMLAWGGWLWRLGASDLTFDEAATYFVAHRPLLQIVDYLRGAVREHPPVYYVLIHTWMALGGTSEFSMRLFSVSAALAGLALTRWLARLAIGHPAAGLLTAVLFAAVPGIAYYARDARMYSLGVVWTMLSAGLFLRDWLPREGWPHSAALVGLTAVHLLALFTHYYLLLPILAQPLVLLINRRWRPLLAWCAAHSLPALMGLGWFWLAPGLEMTTGGFWRRLSLPTPTRFQVFHLLGKVLFSPVVRIHFRNLHILLALISAGVLLAVWRRRAVGAWLALALTMPLVLVYLIPHPPAPRYLVFLTPFAALALGHLGVIPLCLSPSAAGPVVAGETLLKQGLRAVSHRWLTWGMVGGLTLLSVRLLIADGQLYEAITFDRSRYGRTLATVKAHARPGDGVLFYGPWQWIQFHYYDPGGLPPITTLPPYAPPRLKPAEAEPVLEELLARYDRLWVLPAAVDDVDPPHFVAGWLRTHAHMVWDAGDFSLYLPPLPADAPSRSMSVTFGETLRLESVAWEPQPVPAGEPLRLSLYWKPLRRLEDNVRLTLTLADPNGYVWDVAHPLPGEHTSPPSTWQPGQVITDYEGLMVPQGAPPGKYVVRLLVANEATGKPLPVGGDKEAALLTIQVVEPVHAPILDDLPNPETATFCAPDGTACLTLVGYEPGGIRFQQGYAMPFTLHWLVQDTMPSGVQLRLRMLHRPWLPGLRATPIVTRTVPLPLGRATDEPGSPSDVRPGPFRVILPLVTRAAASSAADSNATMPRLVTLPTALLLPPDAPTGPARVMLEVLGPDGRPWTRADGVPILSLFQVTVEHRPMLRRLPDGLTPVQADFGAEIGLRGYRVEGDLRPGGELRVTYAWYARAHPTAIYAVFNHLMTPNSTLVAQADGWPQEGRLLTTQWQAGEYIEDSYTLAIPPDAPPGPYMLYVGLYDAATNKRQPAFLDGRLLPDGRLPIPLPDDGG